MNSDDDNNGKYINAADIKCMRLSDTKCITAEDAK